MRVLGIAVGLEKKGRPTAHCTLIEGSVTTPVLVEAFALTSTNDGLPEVLADLASGLRSRLSGIRPDRVVIRRADVSQHPSKKEGPRIRLLAEGALAAA